MIAAPMLLLLAAPSFEVDGRLGHGAEVRAAAESAWAELVRVGARAGLAAPAGESITLLPGRDLPPGHAARSRPGRVELRVPAPGALAPAWIAALRHELAHQYLLAACAEASEDRLFHESFALAFSGEAATWSEGQYMSVTRARVLLEKQRSLDGPEVRQALGRFLADAPATAEGLPRVLDEKLGRCGSGARWAPLTLAALAGTTVSAAEDALVVLSLASGEVLEAKGASELAMPFGSTLKPFLVAGSGEAPVLPVQDGKQRAEWACGEGLGASIEVRTALARSCNGYFLDWAEQRPQVAQLGAFGPVLAALGLGRLPRDASEAIGLRPTLALSPWAMAQAYRLLAAARPDVLEMLQHTAQDGTLSGLDKVPPGVALKTGTVRDAESRPHLGWIVAVDAERVMVMVRRDRPPRTFFAEMAALIARREGARAQGAVEVQVFGLLPLEGVEVQCAGHGYVAGAEPRAFGAAYTPLLPLARGGEVLCLGRPFLVRFPGIGQPREYAGSFRHDPAPPYRPEPGAPPATPGALRARRGSDLIFRTSRLRYVAGVLAAEDAELRGPARAALAQVVAHNAEVRDRHPGRPLCDTTHCQTFLGTRRPLAEDPGHLAKELELPAGWLLFSQGGDAPWVERRAARAVRELFGPGKRLLSIGSGRLRLLALEQSAEPVDQVEELPCERLRGPLRLPSCPSRFRLEGESYVFEGQGAGHGEGLDVERAKKSSAGAEQILQDAYGPPGRKARPGEE